VATTLLLADDSVTIQRVIELTFAEENVEVITVSDGDQAIAQVERQPPDIVLADVGMPGRTGYEVASYIKASPRLAHIPVILLTGAFEPVDQEKARAARCDAVLAKPFEPQLVITRVRELLNRGRSEDASSPPWDAPLAVTPGDSVDTSSSDLDLSIEAPRVEPAAESLTDYFDQLDAAFAKLPSASAEVHDWPIRQAASAPEREVAPAAEAASEPISDNEFWELTLPTAWKPDMSVSFASPESDFSPAARGEPMVPAVAGHRVVNQAARPAMPRSTVAPPASGSAPSPASAAAPLPPLADAFAAMLAAEQNPDAGASADDWAKPAIVTDEAIDQIVQRVLARMSDELVRTTVTNIVSSVAERLVREEIERIKGAME
jgi:CheY-like chemotaxis protein